MRTRKHPNFQAPFPSRSQRPRLILEKGTDELRTVANPVHNSTSTANSHGIGRPTKVSLNKKFLNLVYTDL